MPKERREQVTVTLDPDLRASVQRDAEAEHRTVSGQIRHIVARVYEGQLTESAA